jgi:uncharacterized protein YceH (UPF0502 family)
VDDVLTDVEVRVVGSLIEKEMTTPDYYPMSLNALTNACNQSSNREPVVSYDDDLVARAIEPLRRKSLVRLVQQSGSRVSKYKHLVNETLGLVKPQAAVLAVLMLRGPQTLGELRTRASRLMEFESLDDVETALNQLMSRSPSALAMQLPRRPGQKEVRFAHLLAGEPSAEAIEAAESHHGNSDGGGRSDRLVELERSVEELRREVTDLRAQLEAFRRQFE